MLMITSPHSGEKVPVEATWLKDIDPLVLLADVDRFVDELYRPICNAQKIPMVAMEIHRYVIDLNRLPSDIDATCVQGASAEKNTAFVSGFHWAKTTLGDVLLSEPIPRDLHEKLTELYY